MAKPVRGDIRRTFARLAREIELVLKITNAMDITIANAEEMFTHLPPEQTEERTGFRQAIVALNAAGVMDRLRLCPVCSQCVFVRDLRRQFCSDSCRQKARPISKRERAAYMRRWRQHPAVKMRVTTRKNRSAK